MKTCGWGDWKYSSTILDLGIRWRWVVSFTPRRLYSRGQSPWCVLDRRFGGSQSRFGRCGERKILYSCRESNPGLPACSPSLYVQTEIWKKQLGFATLLYLPASKAQRADHATEGKRRGEKTKVLGLILQTNCMVIEWNYLKLWAVIFRQG
jgi:hypothetical protein